MRLRRPFPRFLIAALAALGAACMGGGPALLAAETQGFDPAAIDAGVIRRTNAYREKKGLGALEVNAELEKAAQAFADYYVANPGRQALWGHEYGGLTPLDRAENAGFNSRCVGENLGWRGTSGGGLAELGEIDATMVQGWIDSRAHRKNLEFPHYKTIGVGTASYRSDGVLWVVTVQMFGCAPEPKNAPQNGLRMSINPR